MPAISNNVLREQQRTTKLPTVLRITIAALSSGVPIGAGLHDVAHTQQTKYIFYIPKQYVYSKNRMAP
jgi:hypothetical protein